MFSILPIGHYSDRIFIWEKNEYHMILRTSSFSAILKWWNHCYGILFPLISSRTLIFLRLNAVLAVM